MRASETSPWRSARAVALVPYVAVVALVAFVVLLAGPVWAHAIGLSTGTYAARGASVVGRLTFARAEVATLVPALDGNHDGYITAREVASSGELVRVAILARVLVTSGGPCRAVLVDAGLTEQDGLVVSGRWDCPTSDAPFVIDLALLDDLAVGHRHLVGDRVLAGDDRRITLVREPDLPASETPRVTVSPGVWSFFGLGIQHILEGYDHLVFLLGLVLVFAHARARPKAVRSLLAVVTAFTVGHSISLAIAVAGPWSPGPRIIEPAIALSIAYVGIENLFVTPAAAEKRWRLTVVFGLVHGFGLAGALQAIALPRAAIPGALVSFNLGVETGQLAVLAILLPGVLALRRHPVLAARGVRALSIGVAVAGGAWFVVRVLG